MLKYKTSVIIPVYNTEQYLDACIQSVLNQTQRQAEIILVDDGSTDRGYEIMLSYARQYANVKVFQQENKKLGAARNLGMQYAGGKYIFFLDSDDYIKENCLEELYGCAERNRLDFVTYDSEILVECVDERNDYPEYDRSMLGIPRNRVCRGRDYLNEYFGIGGVFVSACLAYYNADFLRKHSISFEEQVYYEDNEFSLKVYYGAERMMYLSQKLYVRRYRENSIMTSVVDFTHLQSALRMSEKCMRILLQISDETENKEGIRAVIAILVNRLSRQIQSYRNKAELYDNQYVLDLCNFFVSCDEKRLLSNIGLELAFEFYHIFSVIISAGYLAETRDILNPLKMRTAMLRHRVEEKVNQLLAGWEPADGKIIIYGTGNVAEKIVNCYTMLYGNAGIMKYRVVFANTNAESNVMYMGKYRIVDIDHIETDSVSMVIVASTKYEREMCTRLDELYGGEYPYVTYREIANIPINGDQ